jgi:hypothetical protein
LLAKSAA